VASCGTPLALQRFKGDKRLEGCIAVPAFRYSRAFSSEVGTGSREENAIKQREKHFRAKHVPREGGDGNRFA
jgi:hypothetical protein